MVQKEVKKKTSVYATVAVLSALVLVSMVYVFGSVPAIFPSTDTPFVSGMRTFDSLDELKTYISNNAYNYNIKGFTTSDTRGALPAAQSLGAEGATGATSYSTTNIQVAGVDEADTLKNDGQYIYSLVNSQNYGGIYDLRYYGGSSSTNTVFIVSADSQNPRVVAKITLDNDTQPAGLFLSSDGNQLVVIASKYQYYPFVEGNVDSYKTMLGFYRSDVYTYVNVYDVTNKASPTLMRNFTASGSYFNSRMIGNNVYVLVSQPAAVYNDLVTLPMVYDGGKEIGTSPSAVYYADTNQTTYYSFTSFYGIDITNSNQQATNMTVMMDGASTMYVSPSNIYVTYPTWTETGSYTSIYRVSIKGLQLAFEAKGSVPGNVLNQYAMDEFNGNLRVATNWYSYSGGEIRPDTGVSSSGTVTQLNNVYVLNQDLTIVGKLEGLASGENLHSVRFMGEKGYLVTFKRTDPLFVIDLSVPSNPKVLGELKIPGYSDYLHPYDATHLIGVGKEAEDIATEDFAWYQGVKLALFDVSNVNNPTQLSNYVIGDRGTDTPVLYEPKAFLFDKAKNLLVIPVSLAIVENKTHASDYGQTVWQGAYVFSVTTDGGFILRGTITHLNQSLLNSQGQISNPYDFWNTQNDHINRALYIGNTLYTISNGQIKLNSLSDLSQIGSVNLQ